MCRKAELLILTLITSAVMAMDNEEVLGLNATMVSMEPHTLMSLNPAEDSIVDCEDLAPPPQQLEVFLVGILYPVTPGMYVDFLEQVWNVSEFDAFVQFVGNRHDYTLTLDFVRPAGVYTYPETGMISVIYDFIKDNEQFFSLELTRIPDEYRIVREQENREYHAMREMQDREYQESLARDREHQLQQAELTKMRTEDVLSRLSINVPLLRASTPPPLLLTKEQVRARNAAAFAKLFVGEKNIIV